MDYDEVICSCMGVTIGMIKDAVDSGASSLEEVQDVTGAATACGACLDTVQELTDRFLAEKK